MRRGARIEQAANSGIFRNIAAALKRKPVRHGKNTAAQKGTPRTRPAKGHNESIREDKG